MTGFVTAAELSLLGFKVFPIAAGGKSPPLWQDWPNRATSEPDRATWPENANTGVHCAGMAVLDIDPAKGGVESLLTLDMSDDVLPDTLQSVTPRGGRHLFYRLPAGHPGVPNRVGSVLGAGIDIRSTGGYVLGAGSKTADGAYEWDNYLPIADAPQWLLDRLGAPRDASESAGTRVPDADEATLARAQGWLDARPGAVEGRGGDAYTFSTAAFLRDYGLSQQQTYGLLLEWNARCSPPWGLDDLGIKVKNAYAYAAGEPGAKAITADDFPTVELPVTVGTIPVNAQNNRRGAPVSLASITSQPAGGANYLIKGMLLQQSYAMLDGNPGEGKTFLALDMAYHVAAGREWMGRRVRQGVVLYVGFEAYGGLGNRARALRGKYEADAPLYFSPGGFDIRTSEGRRLLGESLALLPEKPKLIVLDTFAYALGNGDENSAQDVGAFNGAVQALIESTGACVLLIHHTGKDASKGARGSSALPAAIDTELMVADRTLTTIKQRDIELGGPIGFALVPILIGTDDDGDSIMSCVVDPANIPERREMPRRGTLSDLVWAELNRRRPNNEPISVQELRDYCAEFLPAGDSALRRAFSAALLSLTNQGLIEQDNLGLITRRME